MAPAIVAVAVIVAGTGLKGVPSIEMKLFPKGATVIGAVIPGVPIPVNVILARITCPVSSVVVTAPMTLVVGLASRLVANKPSNPPEVAGTEVAEEILTILLS